MNGGVCSSTISEGSQCSCRSPQLVEPFCTVDCRLPNVQCLNGGTCTHHGLCFCHVGSHGELCEESDNAPPEVSNCPDDIVEMVSAGVTTRSVFWTPPTATDSSGYTVSTSHTPGSQFGVGRTPVTYTFTDSARNQERCTFFVTVQQDVAITCPVDGVGVFRAGTVIGVWSDPVCSGGVSPYTVSCTPQSGSVIGVGDTVVTCTCTDVRGTTKQCHFLVSVDDEPPIISNCPTSPIFVYIPIGQTQGEATWTEPTASDASGSVTVSQTHSPGDSFPVGTTQVRYEFRDRFRNMATCPFTVSVYTVDIDPCPQSITIPYGNQLSYGTPQCTRNSGSTSETIQSTCNPGNGMRAEQNVFVICRCSMAPEVTCSFQVTVTTSVQCPSQMTISPGETLSYNTPQCMSGQGSRPASCSPSTGSSVTTDTSVTCTCPQDGNIRCSFQIFVDCLAVMNTFCVNPGVSCDCMDESCDLDTGICNRSCTIVNTCPASIESKSLSQVNPSSSVDITCTLRGSTTILLRLRLRLSSRSDSLDETGITRLTGDGVNTGDKVVSTSRVGNVTKEQTFFCVLLQGNFLIGGVSVEKFVHELPVLNAAPSSENVSNTSITISWRAWDPAMDDGDPPIVAYIPYYRRKASDEWISGPRILTNETLQFKADNLEVDTLYEFSVAVVREGENGEGRRSSSMKVKTLCNVPHAVASVNVELTSSNKVNVSWQLLPPGEVMCSTGVTSYKVYYRIEGSVDDTPQLAGTVEDADMRSFIVDDGVLEPGSSYIFFVTVTTNQESDFRESEAIEAPAPPPGSLVGIIVAVISVVFLLIILALVVLLLIRRKRDKEAGNNTPVPKPVDNTYDNPVFGIPDVHSRQDAEPAKAAEPVPQMQPSVREDYENKSVENLSIEKESSPDDVIYGNLEQPKPIRVAEFGEYFRQNVDKFDHEFSILEGSKKQFDWTAAEDPANKKKNRFKSMYTYDHSRVVLRDLPDQEGSDYYNASFIKDTNDVVAYIASQAPNRASLEDFVRMIWEQHVTTIVMVANLYEEGKERCLQYWPENEGGSTSFGSVTVTWLKTTQFSDFVIRYFTFKRGKDTREVQQLHFLTWPDKDTPEHGTALIEFTKQSKILHRGKKFPMLVHCSAGIGRTGTFICLNCMMDVLRDEEYIDVFGFVNKIRQNRINMVQTSKQYVFLYKCLNEYYLTHQTEMSVSQMTRLNVESHRGILLGEFELLSELGHNHRKDTVKNCVGKKKENIARNRVRNMVPSNRNRVFLMSPGQSNEKDYINASYVKSFQKKDAFITTQSPLPSTIEDFWRMVYDLKSPLIVMLNQLDPTDKYQHFEFPDFL
ncbi:Receptor-type tyrosine-protein phosphatase alpha [Holothuria leucospilota]|uniref:protein-tyrosine-phosphatase n=1 Tax=Holothuria leucospilota TaxID=206669 RepID=A0A9Q1C934_HOLLE|nr:Receptor-type tyrosine-protein phosphatase alpha [Holothuria leucospilota]